MKKTKPRYDLNIYTVIFGFRALFIAEGFL